MQINMLLFIALMALQPNCSLIKICINSQQPDEELFITLYGKESGSYKVGELQPRLSLFYVPLILYSALDCAQHQGM